MILGQLIQTGRHFCECRSIDFVPATSDEIVLIAYSAGERFLARSLSHEAFDVHSEIQSWFAEVQAIAYMAITRPKADEQADESISIEDRPVDFVTITAGTAQSLLSASFLLEELNDLGTFKLTLTRQSFELSPMANLNLLHADYSLNEKQKTTINGDLLELA